MSEGIAAARCPDCGCQTFPPRTWCPACGSDRLATACVTEGIVAEATTLRRMVGEVLQHPVHIGSVRLDGGGVAIVRLSPGTGPGDRVRLSMDRGAPTARALKPGSVSHDT